MSEQIATIQALLGRSTTPKTLANVSLKDPTRTTCSEYILICQLTSGTTEKPPSERVKCSGA